MSHLTAESATKLQLILSKRLGYKLSDDELAQAYANLMEFTFALTDLEEVNQETSVIKPFSQQPIENYAVSAV